jgi:hypothetical protein
VPGDAVHQPTWPLLLKIEHMVKLQVLGNNSKTVNNIKNDGCQVMAIAHLTLPFGSGELMTHAVPRAIPKRGPRVLNSMFVANLHNVTITHLPTGTVILNIVVCF